MRHSPFASPSKALTFVTVVVLGGLFLSDTVDDIDVDRDVDRAEDVSPEPAPAPHATIAAVTTSGEPSVWDDSGNEDPNLDVEIAVYTPPSSTRTAEAAEGQVAFTGRRPIPTEDTRVVK